MGVTQPTGMNQSERKDTKLPPVPTLQEAIRPNEHDQ